MAWKLPEIRCALCDEAIDARGPYFRADGAFLPRRDPLTRFANAPLHWSCYGAWTHRPRFAAELVGAWVKANRRNPFWWSVWQDERAYVSVNPQPPVEEVSVRLMQIGNDIRVPLARWQTWLDRPEAVTPTLQAIEKAELATVLPELRQRLPDDHAVVDAIDPAEKRPRVRQHA